MRLLSRLQVNGRSTVSEIPLTFQTDEWTKTREWCRSLDPHEGRVRVSVSALCEPQEEPTWTLTETRIRQKKKKKTNLLAGTGCFFLGRSQQNAKKGVKNKKAPHASFSNRIPPAHQSRDSTCKKEKKTGTK